MELKKFIQDNKKIIVRVSAALVILPIFLVLMLFILVRFEIITDLPSRADLKAINNPEASELYASDNSLISKYFIENRTNIDSTNLNPFFVKALIATEDVRFFDHNGIDKRSLARVFFKSILMRDRSSGGGSTLSQQVIKNIYPRERFRFMSSVVNKIREMVLAKRLEKVYSKDEILLMYTNTVSFGERAFGLETASRRFFNKPSNELLLEEAATLVGILKAPSYYSPRNHPERAKNRRNVVLSQMVKYDILASDIRDQLSDLPVTLDYQPSVLKNEFAKYYKKQVAKEFNEWSDGTSKPNGAKYNLYTDGLKVYTSLDLDLQLAAEKNMQKHMKNLQRQFEQSWEGGKMFGNDTRIIDDYIIKHPLYKRLKEEGKNNKEILSHFTTHGDRRLWTWDGYEERRATRIDSIKHYQSLLHAGVLAMDPRSGFIKVWVGGNDYGEFQYDRIKEPRQVGSTFKPIVYLTALEQGKELCDVYPNELRTYTSYKDWTPKNADGEYGGELTMSQALINSVNTVSVQVLFDASIPKVVNQAQKMGIYSDLAAVPSMVLGTSDVSLFEMVNVYACMANQGYKPEMRSIVRIENRAGEVLYEAEDIEVFDQVADPENIEAMNKILHQVNINGTGRRLYNVFDIKTPISGKTGTTQNQSDGWYIGYTPELVIGAWVGTEDRRIHFRSLGTGSGGNTALPLVGALFEYAQYQKVLARNEYSDIDDISACVDGPEKEILVDILEDIIFPNEGKGRSKEERSRRRIEDISKEKKKLMQILDELRQNRKKKKRRN